jgi:hypothetical protein
MDSLQGPAVGMTPLQFAGPRHFPMAAVIHATSGYCYGEGVTDVAADGETVLTMVSDENFSIIQHAANANHVDGLLE